MVARPREEFDRYVRGEEERWRKLIQDAGSRSNSRFRPVAATIPKASYPL